MSLGEIFVNFLLILYRVGIVVCACDRNYNLGVLLGKLLGFLEVVLGSLVLTVEKIEGAFADIVESIFGIGGETLVEISLSSSLVTLGERYLTEIVVGESIPTDSNTGLNIWQAVQSSVQ